MIIQESIDEVVRRSDLVALVERSRSVTRSGRNFKALCPFHDERTPSFYIWPDTNSYYCFGCQAAGNVITYVMETEGYSFPEALEVLATQAGIELKRSEQREGSRSKGQRELLLRANSFAAKLFHGQLLHQNCSQTLWDYLNERGVSRELAIKFQLGFAARGSLLGAFKRKGVDFAIGVQAGLLKATEYKSAGERHFEYLQGRLVFPIRSQPERVVGFGGRIVPGLSGESHAKYLNSPETAIYNKSEVLYGLCEAGDSIRHKDEVFVVEGYLDVLGLHRVGITNVVATCGTAFTVQHAKRLARLARRIFLLFDGDKAGIQAASRSLGVIGSCRADIKIIILPNGEDPDDFAKRWGPQTVQQLLDLPRIAPLDHFLNVQVAQYGARLGDLGESAKHAILLATVKEIANVDQDIVLAQLTERVAFKLGIRADLVMRALVEVRDSKAGSANSLYSSREQESRVEQENKISELTKSLAAVDKALILVALVLADEFPRAVLQDPAVVCQLHPGALQVLELLLAEPAHPSGDKDTILSPRVSELLKGFGINISALLAEVERLREAGQERLIQILRESVWYLRRGRLRQLSREVELRLRNETEEAERQQLALAQLRLLRESDAIKMDRPLEWERVAN